MTSDEIKFYRYLHLHHDMSPREYAKALHNLKVRLAKSVRAIGASK